jgi:L-ascorbate metabolism protein UlaG (beta-lactamase superfamily)
MKLTYIYHSGFAVECEQCTVIFDYYRDSADDFVRRSLPVFKGKPYVLSSHWHPDHFNRDILKWKEIRPDIAYIFSADIRKKRFAATDEASFLRKGDVWEDHNLRIRAFGSTDAGVSFLVETDGKRIFHAGDLNNWHWDEESTEEEIRAAENHFLRELKDIANEVQNVDLAMFPIDCRLGKNYMRGAQQFVDSIKTAVFVPMHFGETYTEANAFRRYAEKAGCRFVSLKKTGEEIDLQTI